MPPPAFHRTFAMMKLLDRYILTRFLTVFAGALLVFITVFTVADLVENMDKFIDAKMPGRAIAIYYLYTFPWFISIALPMATLIATFFSMGMLNKRNEITAMKASGFSVRRIGRSIIISGLVISAFSFFFDDIIVSEANRKKSEVQNEFLSREYRKKHKVRRQNIYLQQSPTEIIGINRYDYRTKTAIGFFQQYFDAEGNLIERLDIATLRWESDGSQWLGKNYTHRQFSMDSGAELLVVRGADTVLAINLTPTDLTKMSVTPAEMRFNELGEFVNSLILNGVDPTRWEVNRQFKLAFAFTSLIMVLFGLPLSMGKPRSSLAFGAGLSVLVIFGYYVAIKLGQSLGFKGILDPMLSVWLPNLLFLSMGIILLQRLRS